MAIETYTLTFTQQMADLPIVYNLGRKYNIVPVIKKAQISENAGWLQLALQGDRDEIQRAMAELLTQGVIVTPTHLSPLTSDTNPLP